MCVFQRVYKIQLSNIWNKIYIEATKNSIIIYWYFCKLLRSAPMMPWQNSWNKNWMDFRPIQIKFLQEIVDDWWVLFLCFLEKQKLYLATILFFNFFFLLVTSSCNTGFYSWWLFLPFGRQSGTFSTPNLFGETDSWCVYVISHNCVRSE